MSLNTHQSRLSAEQTVVARGSQDLALYFPEELWLSVGWFRVHANRTAHHDLKGWESIVLPCSLANSSLSRMLCPLLTHAILPEVFVNGASITRKSTKMTGWCPCFPPGNKISPLLATTHQTNFYSIKVCECFLLKEHAWERGEKTHEKKEQFC